MAFAFVCDLAGKRHSIKPDGTVNEEPIGLIDTTTRRIPNAVEYEYREDADAAMAAFRARDTGQPYPMSVLYSYDWWTLPWRDFAVEARVFHGTSAHRATWSDTLTTVSPVEPHTEPTYQERLAQIMRLVNGHHGDS